MKKNFLYAGLLVAGVLAGWFLGYLRLPFADRDYVFLMGFIAGITLALLLLVLWLMWVRHKYLLRALRSASKMPDTPGRHYQILWWLFALVIAGGALSVFVFSHRLSRTVKKELKGVHEQLKQQAYLTESTRMANLLLLLNSIIDNAEQELQQQGTLSDAVIARLAALSFSLKPYRLLRGDSLSARPYSPERGQLLQALLLLQPDSASLARIRQRVTFAGADLAGAQLSRVDLQGVDLRGANLQAADLGGSNLLGADLTDADLSEANLKGARLTNASLRRADLRWSRLDSADLRFAVLDGARMDHAHLVHTTLHSASALFAFLHATVLYDTDLSHAVLRGSKFDQASLQQVNLSRADLRLTSFAGAYLQHNRFDLALVDSTWHQNLTRWQPDGMQALVQTYSLVQDTTDKYNNRIYRLRNKS
ncbi:MAG: pentapeptide repeat-containing protein [Chitinophagales bacterium]|nr:pentapeptide repeat-containing protein [Chitinophagales bacterium]MDW8428355.1 pentapeptide repeat-containing protein [Chitinophagales bacterium]